MTADQHIRAFLSNVLNQLAGALEQVDTLSARVAELEAKYEPKPAKLLARVAELEAKYEPKPAKTDG